MPLLRRNYTAAYLADIGGQGTNGRLAKRGDAYLRQAEFSVNVHSESFAPGYIPIPTFTDGVDQYGRHTKTPGPFSVWSPFSGRIVENQPLAPHAVKYPSPWLTYAPTSVSTRRDAITLASWDVEQPFDETYGEHDQTGFVFHFTEKLDRVVQPRFCGRSAGGPPQSVPDWFWAARVVGTLELGYWYRYAGGDGAGNGGGKYYDTERGQYMVTFGNNAFDGADDVIDWSAWIYGPREQHRVRGTGLEIYGNMADFESDLLVDDPALTPSEAQYAALVDTWLRNEVAGICLQLTTYDAHAA